MSSIKELPEFASLCSFIQLFGEELNVSLTHNQLAKFLEVKDAENVPKIWIDIHRRLLSRIKYHCSIDKWEGTLKKCLSNILGYDSELANLNGTNYFGITADNRAKILNILFDCQFDKNIKFKEKVNLKFISDLRTQPFGSDIHGCVYWLFVDSDVSIIMYKENLEEESFKIVAETLEGMHKLQEELSEIEIENTFLSKLYSETSPSDDVDNSRNQSPFIDNTATFEKSTIKTDPVKLENINDSPEVKTEELEGNDENSLVIDQKPISPNNEFVKDIKSVNNIVKDEEAINLSSIDKHEPIEDKKIDDNIQEDCETPEKKKKKLIKKGNDSPTITPEDSYTNSGLRRSERKRKPVNLFSINYSDSFKKMKSSSHKNDKENFKKINKEESEHKKPKEKRKKGRPRKSTEYPEIKLKEKKKTKKYKTKHKKGRGHKKHRSKNPWENADSSEEHIEMEDDDDVYMNQESEGSISIKEMWDDKPESDFDVDKISCSSDEETSKARGRNYFRQKSIKKKKQEIDDKPCQICLRNNIPEMILLCDDCDLGHHAMCLRPSLMIIPEGDWYCPKCQHKKLVSRLAEKIGELEKSQVRNNAKIRMQERLNFVNISMTNILTKNQERKRIRKQSCESDNDSQTDCNSSSQSLSSSSGSYESSDNSSESESKTRGRYKFRETSRKDKTKYNFEEIDKMFDDALEHDEKYKLLKKEHEVRYQKSELSQSLESEPEYDYSGIEPRKKSSGKDMANIVNENKPPPAPLLKRKRLKYDSDNDEFEDDTKDIDFKLSDQSDSEFDEYECIEGDVTNCSDDDWIVNKKRASKKSSRKKDRKRSITGLFGCLSRPRRKATRNVNYRNMLGDEDDEEESITNEQSPDYESSEDDDKPPPVVSRKKGKDRHKKRIISDSEYEEENSRSESAVDSGSTEKLEAAAAKRKHKPDLNSDSDAEEEYTQSKIPKIENDDSKSVDNFFATSASPPLLLPPSHHPPVSLPTPLVPVHLLSHSTAAIVAETPVFPSLAAILNPMRAKADEDDDIENEVESETECDLTICEDLSNQNLVPKV